MWLGKQKYTTLSLLGVVCFLSAAQASDSGLTAPQYKLILSPGVGNTLPDGQSVISIDSNPPPSSAPVVPRGVPVNRNLQQLYPANIAGCSESSINICGSLVQIAQSASFGDIVEITTPPPFVPGIVDVQCVVIDGVPTYKIASNSAVTCETTTPP